MGWQAARPCADTGAPDNGMWKPEGGRGDTGRGLRDALCSLETVQFCCTADHPGGDAVANERAPICRMTT